MFKIGEFSRFTKVSIKMLRHYDEIGLLKPAFVDPLTNYRYYAASQLTELNRIIALKDFGFSLEQILGLMDDKLQSTELRGMLKFKRVEILERIRQEQARLAQVEAKLMQLDTEDDTTQYDVVLRKVAPQIMATIRDTVPTSGGHITLMFEELEAYIGCYHVRESSPPMIIYHDPDYREDKMDIEVAVPINGALPMSERVTVREIEGYPEMACTIHTGGYNTVNHALNALLTWIDLNNYRINGSLRKVYLRFGADNTGYTVPDAYLAKNGAHEFVTEVQVPVVKNTISQNT